MPFELPPTEVPAGWFAVLESLNAHRAEYVIAGTTAEAIVGGGPLERLVIAPAPYRRNLERVEAALGARRHRHVPIDLEPGVRPWPAATVRLVYEGLLVLADVEFAPQVSPVALV